MTLSEEKVKIAVRKLEQSAGWIKLLGIVQVIYGVLTAVAIVGILWVWLGLVLIKVSNNLRLAREGDEQALVEASQNLATYFTAWGIIALVGAAIAAIAIVLWIIFTGKTFTLMGIGL